MDVVCTLYAAAVYEHIAHVATAGARHMASLLPTNRRDWFGSKDSVHSEAHCSKRMCEDLRGCPSG